ncbi:MAG TPA: SIS domain-containing protein [Actinomycetes bacterium]|nr:SIS domain-containing protein [Actinomycetes bacterium]
MDPAGFLADVERRPETLAYLADVLVQARPFTRLLDGIDEIVLLGMGSSAYAAGVAAARMRAHGLRATAELASSDLLPPPRSGQLVVAVSASGTSPETLDATERYRGRTRVLAVTEVGGSPLDGLAIETVPLLCGPEEGGVACRSFTHTQAVLLALEKTATGRLGDLTPVLEAAVDATADLMSRRDRWLPAVADHLDGPAGVYIAAPARRFGTAQQSALMVREGPRRPSTACETGDWNHVDVYLTKTLDYRLLLLAGSAQDGELLGWTAQRGSTVVTVGADPAGSAYGLRYAHDDVDDVRLLADVVVAELVAHRWWASP